MRGRLAAGSWPSVEEHELNKRIATKQIDRPAAISSISSIYIYKVYVMMEYGVFFSSPTFFSLDFASGVGRPLKVHSTSKIA